MNKTKTLTGKVPHRRIDMKKLNAGDDVLIVGGGGREHAIAWALKRSPRINKLFGAPGNAGMPAEPTGLAATDIDGIVEYAKANRNIKTVIVAPDDPLALGLVDRLTAAGIRAFGPTQAAAKLEWSKAYAKDFMKKHGIPTAEYQTFADAEKAKEYVKECKLPVVLKADGLALGKGVIICNTRDEAVRGVDEIMLDKKFGAAGERLVAEEFLCGYEVSLLAFCDGTNYRLMPTSCDHKRALDGDKGLNTGGMGAYSPCPVFDKKLTEKAEAAIVAPTVAALKKEGAPFKGVLYFGLMVCGGDIKVLEYNARFGDPETQSVLPLLESDLYAAFDACIDGTLDKAEIVWSDKKSINVVLASGGYPLEYKKGMKISGLNAVDGDVNVFFAGVKSDGDGLVTSGGRVLCVQALADDFAAAKQKVYDNIKRICFDGCFYRRDIGGKL